MEITSVSNFIDYYQRIRARTLKVISVVPPEHLNFAYMEGKFTIGDQIRHIATIERYLFAETIAGRPSAYEGCGETLAESYDDILQFFHKLHKESLAIFENLTDNDLQKKCKTPDGANLTIWKWLRAMVEHEIHHRAQLFLYLNMLNIKTPPIFGLTSEELQAKSIKK